MTSSVSHSRKARPDKLMVNGPTRRTRADFDLLVLEHLDAAYNLARWLMRNPHEAEDAVQDACLRAFQAFDGYAGGSAKAWLLTIVRNVCLTRLRRGSSPKVVRLDDVMAQVDQLSATPNITSAENRPDMQLIAAQDRSRVSQAIARLPEAFREAIVLREIEELSYQDIAAIAGVPIGTVMSRLARGRERLKALLANGQEGRHDEL
jgi:RNA polymerase sigma-70 factor (ECF subfamily)